MTFKTEVVLAQRKGESNIFEWNCPLCGQKETNYASAAMAALARLHLIHNHKVTEEIEVETVAQQMCNDMIGIGGAGMSVQCTLPKHGEEYLHQVIYEDDFLGQKVLMTWS